MGNPVRPLETVPGPVPVPDPSRELPARAEAEPRLRETGERIGSALGSAARRLRELPRLVSEKRERLQIASSRTGEDASAAAAEWKQTARQKMQETRTRVSHLANQYPLQVIAGVAGFFFVVGFALRIWRSNHARHQ